MDTVKTRLVMRCDAPRGICSFFDDTVQATSQSERFLCTDVLSESRVRTVKFGSKPVSLKSSFTKQLGTTFHHDEQLSINEHISQGTFDTKSSIVKVGKSI